MFLKHWYKLSLGLFGLALASCSGGGNENDMLAIDYLPVQKERGENWSIIDADGKVVVKEEYAPEDKMSLVFPGGVYWVKSAADKKFRLFSIDSPKTPLTDEEYEEVTAFSDGLAFVSHVTTPIQMINSKGKVVKTLPGNVCGIRVFPNDVYTSALWNDMAVFEDKNGKCGYINADGEIVIKALYKDASRFSENLAIVQEEGSNDYTIIDKNGEKKGTVNTGKYEILEHIFSEGKLPVKDLQTEKLVYLDEKGNVKLKPVKDFVQNEQRFVSGYAVVRNMSHERAVINEKGESVIRAGKYSWIVNLGEGLFTVEKNNKCGVVDAEDNTILDFNYSAVLATRLGNNFVCKESSFFLVDKKGEEIKNSEFEDVNVINLPAVSFVDIQSTAQAFVADVEPNGFKPILGKKGVAEIAEVYKLDAQQQSHYVSELEADAFKADLSDVTVRLDFTTRVVKEKTHKEVVNDGWFAHEKTVSDGWGWNDEAQLKCVVLKMQLNEKVNFNTMADAVGKQLEKKGFKFIGPIPSDRIYEAKNGDKFARVVISEGRGGGVSLSFSPYAVSSGEAVDYE